MKKVLTAIGNPMLNRKLKKTEEWNVLADDIDSDELLIEYLERGEKIDILFLYSKIIQNYTIDEFIDILKEIQENMFIVFFKEQDVEIKGNNNLEVCHDLEVDVKVFEKLLQKEKSANETSNLAKTIAISGSRGVGKSTFSTFLAKNVEKQNIKTLLFDFDLEENHIRTLLKIKKAPQYHGNMRDILVNVSKNLDCICHLDLAFQNKHEIDFFKIQKMLKEFRNEYDLIIIDTSSDLENKFTKRIFYNSDTVLFLMEPNILGVKKTKNMLEVFEKDWKITNDKMKIILNKTNIYQISETILKEIFPDIQIIGKMKYQDSYNLLMNKNVDKREIRKEYEKIYKKI